jgi:hypothetical protein
LPRRERPPAHARIRDGSNMSGLINGGSEPYRPRPTDHRNHRVTIADVKARYIVKMMKVSISITFAGCRPVTHTTVASPQDTKAPSPVFRTRGKFLPLHDDKLILTSRSV